MKRIPIVLMILMLFCTYAKAASVDNVLSGLNTINTFTARFVQTKHLSLFSGDVTTRGTVAYRKPGDMIFHGDPPDDQIVLIRPSLGLVTSYSPGTNRAKRIHFPPNSIPPWMSFGLGSTKDPEALKDAAVVTASDAGGLIVLTFVPKDTTEAVKEVSVTLKMDYTPLKVRITEKSGDFTLIEFSEQHLNPSLGDALFDIKIPRGVTVEEIGK